MIISALSHAWVSLNLLDSGSHCSQTPDVLDLYGRPGVPHMMAGIDFQTSGQMGPTKAWWHEAPNLTSVASSSLQQLDEGPDGAHSSWVLVPLGRPWVPHHPTESDWRSDGPWAPQASVAHSYLIEWVLEVHSFCSDSLTVKYWGIHEPITPLEVYASTNQSLQ